MPRIAYQTQRFTPETEALIDMANQIIAAYEEQGLDLTLRQLYYQFVARDWFPESWADKTTGSVNNERSYKRLGDAIANGRMAGLIDWDAITDRTRYVRDLAHWDSPAAIVEACSTQFRLKKWDEQPSYVEVWIEKDALIGVVEQPCRDNDVPYLACRGYASASEVWRAGHERLRPQIRMGKVCHILYLGDHDPSGIDMTRDVEERLKVFSRAEAGEVHVHRLALNMPQVEQYDPPPNPTKLTDSRATGYIREFGHECWELDALDPVVIRDLITDAIAEHRVDAVWQKSLRAEEKARKELELVAGQWAPAVKAARAAK